MKGTVPLFGQHVSDWRSSLPVVSEELPDISGTPFVFCQNVRDMHEAMGLFVELRVLFMSKVSFLGEV